MSVTTLHERRRAADLSIKTIHSRKSLDAIKYDTAIRIREILDAARKEYGDDWDNDEAESYILELVTEDE